MNFPKLHTNDLAQELYTPPEATKQIIPFIPKNKIIWEMCYGRGDNCFQEEPENYDIIITNPPYRNNKDFLQKAINSGKPFALLMRLEHLGGVKASKLLKDLDIKILIPEKRINFITPKMRDGEKVGGSQFHTVWITYGLVSGNKQIIYL